MQHALLLGDASLLKLMLYEMVKYKVEPATMIHAMQNHDEVTYELLHFVVHRDDYFQWKGEELTGQELRDLILGEMTGAAITPDITYNGLSGNGLCTTFVGLAASALKIKNPFEASKKEQDAMRRGHLLFAFYNCMQPGVFALSAWDLVGALPVEHDRIKDFTDVDGDWRWLNRGSFDLLGHNPNATKSNLGSFSFISHLISLQEFRTSTCSLFLRKLA